MTDDAPTMFVAVYEDVSTALSDYQLLEDAEHAGQVVVEGSVILSRNDKGRVFATATGYELLRSDLPSRHDAALVIGLFAPPLLFLSARDAGGCSSFDELVRKHDERKMGFVVDDFLAYGSSAVVVLLEDHDPSSVASTLSHARMSSSTAVDWEDYHTVERVLTEMNLRTLMIVGSEEFVTVERDGGICAEAG
jgi:hypothetical protein